MRYAVVITLLVFFFLSCSKPEEKPAEEDFDQHPTWTRGDSTAFWDKQQGDITIKPFTR